VGKSNNGLTERDHEAADGADGAAMRSFDLSVERAGLTDWPRECRRRDIGWRAVGP
jgi:hypothetical protein